MAFTKPKVESSVTSWHKDQSKSSLDCFVPTTHTNCRPSSSMDLNLDPLRLKDDKGNIILCSYCAKSAMGKRPIIHCDFCSRRFHLDCVDPPMANPPQMDEKAKHQRRTWKCPNHIDLYHMTSKDAEEDDTRQYKMRQPKNPKLVTSFLKRGVKNNGLIVIEDDESDDDDEFSTDGVIQRMKQSTIKLDFIARAKR